VPFVFPGDIAGGRGSPRERTLEWVKVVMDEDDDGREDDCDKPIESRTSV
jgi:hypothetical protein